MWLPWRRLPERLAVLVKLEARLLKVPDYPLGELLPGIVGRVFAHDPTQQIPAARDGEGNREGELIAEAAMIHGACVPVLFSPHVIARRRRGCQGALNPGTIGEC